MQTAYITLQATEDDRKRALDTLDRVLVNALTAPLSNDDYFALLDAREVLRWDIRPASWVREEREAAEITAANPTGVRA